MPAPGERLTAGQVIGLPVLDVVAEPPLHSVGAEPGHRDMAAGGLFMACGPKEGDSVFMINFMIIVVYFANFELSSEGFHVYR
jgi:hypothetical protein